MMIFCDIRIQTVTFEFEGKERKMENNERVLSFHVHELSSHVVRVQHITRSMSGRESCVFLVVRAALHHVRLSTASFG